MSEGRTDPASTYAVGREKIREFALAVGETHPLHHDLEAARAAGHDDLVAPPMFAVVYSLPGLEPALRDPDLGMDWSRMVHGGQEFRWGPLVIAGDEVRTEARVHDVRERASLRFYVFATRSTNQRGETVCEGTWTMVVR